MAHGKGCGMSKRSSTPDYSSREACIQRVRNFLKVWDQCAAQGMIASTGAATVLWTEDLREVLSVVPSETTSITKERDEAIIKRDRSGGPIADGTPKPEHAIAHSATTPRIRCMRPCARHEGIPFTFTAYADSVATYCPHCEAESAA
jgi:hypothetical protein